MAAASVEATSKALADFVPDLLNQTYFDKSANKGKGAWLPRLQAAAGPHKSGNDPHIAGLALDIILFAKETKEKDYAERICAVFLALKEKMKFSSVIYNGSEWNGQGVKFPHIDEAHKTHIHIQWREAASGGTDFKSDLEDALETEFEAANIASGAWAQG